jgi:hypothetical protein
LYAILAVRRDSSESRFNYHWISFRFSSLFRAFLQQTSSHSIQHHERTIVKRTKEKPKGAATMTTFQCRMSYHGGKPRGGEQDQDLGLTFLRLRLEKLPSAFVGGKNLKIVRCGQLTALASGMSKGGRRKNVKKHRHHCSSCAYDFTKHNHSLISSPCTSIALFFVSTIYLPACYKL